MKLNKQKLTEEIGNTYDQSIQKGLNQIKAFEIISQRSEFLHEKVSEMKSPGTLWRYKMNKVYEIINKTITASDIGNLDNIDYTESVIQASVSDFNEIHRMIGDIKFIPINQTYLKKIRGMFANSHIMTENLIEPEFISMFEKLRSAELLYRLTDDGGTPQSFHSKCDNKGPTIMIIKTEDDRVFGGYNPTSWISEYVYSQGEEAFIFSVTDGRARGGIKGPIDKHKTDKAIKQNESKFSPGFGEANNSDLFIAFKKLENSYSRLGHVYRCPYEYDPYTFLAGSETGWDIVEIEVWSVN